MIEPNHTFCEYNKIGKEDKTVDIRNVIPGIIVREIPIETASTQEVKIIEEEKRETDMRKKGEKH